MAANEKLADEALARFYCSPQFDFIISSRKILSAAAIEARWGMEADARSAPRVFYRGDWLYWI